MNKRDFFRYSSKILNLDPDDWIYNSHSCDSITYIGTTPRMTSVKYSGSNLYGPTYIYQLESGHHVVLSGKEESLEYVKSYKYEDRILSYIENLADKMSYHNPYDTLIRNHCYIPDIMADPFRLTFMDFIDSLRRTNLNYYILEPFIYDGHSYEGLSVDNGKLQITIGLIND